MNEFDLSGVKVGDTVYIVPSDSRDRPYESVVKTVGRKYITVDNGYYTKFNKENGINPEWSHWRMYSSKQAYEAEREMNNMMRYITRNIDRCYFSREELESIYKQVEKALERRGLRPI